MAIDLKYGTVTVESKSIPDNEPVFVLRAQDALALFAMNAYEEAASTACCEKKFMAQLAQARIAFREWGRKKLPD
jgi:hypothetical protein